MKLARELVFNQELQKELRRHYRKLIAFSYAWGLNCWDCKLGIGNIELITGLRGLWIRM